MEEIVIAKNNTFVLKTEVGFGVELGGNGREGMVAERGCVWVGLGVFGLRER